MRALNQLFGQKSSFLKPINRLTDSVVAKFREIGVQPPFNSIGQGRESRFLLMKRTEAEAKHCGYKSVLIQGRRKRVGRFETAQNTQIAKRSQPEPYFSTIY